MEHRKVLVSISVIELATSGTPSYWRAVLASHWLSRHPIARTETPSITISIFCSFPSVFQDFFLYFFPVFGGVLSIEMLFIRSRQYFAPLGEHTYIHQCSYTYICVQTTSIRVAAATVLRSFTHPYINIMFILEIGRVQSYIKIYSNQFPLYGIKTIMQFRTHNSNKTTTCNF